MSHVILGLLFFAGCATQSPTPARLDHDYAARDLMKTAQSLEDAKQYQKAINEYVTLAKKYPRSVYYQTAVKKAAWLNLQPDNPEADPNAALHWLQIYLTLPIGAEERQSEELRMVMLQQVIDLSARLSRYAEENINLKTATKNQSAELAKTQQQVKNLETELAQTRIQLEEMKEVDLRMHTRRVNGSHIKPFNPSQPEKTTEKTSDAGDPKAEVTPHAHHPYTVQVRAYADKEVAVTEAMKARKSGNLGFSSHISIPGKGNWYRVFIGVYKTLDDALEKAQSLKGGGYPNAFAIKLPYAIKIDMSSLRDDQQQKKTLAELQSMGYLTYAVPDEKGPEKTLLIGAFETQKESESVSDKLRSEGFTPEVIQR